MELVPWLVVHGVAAWSALGALFCLAGLAIARTLLRRAQRALTLESLLALGPPEPLLADPRPATPVTVAGALALEGEAIESFVDGAPAAATTAVAWSRSLTRSGGATPCLTHRAAGLKLRVGDLALGIDGPVVVLRGSSENTSGRPTWSLRAAARQRLRRAAPDEKLPFSEQEPLRFRSVRQGDQVRLRGIVEPAPGSADRTAGELRIIAPPAPHAGGLPIAFEGAPHEQGGLVVLLGAALAAALFLALSLAVGEGCLPGRDFDARSAKWGNDWPLSLQVASAFPFSRRRALHLLGEQKASLVGDSPGKSLQVWLALNDLRGHCADNVQMLLSRRMYWPAVQRGAHCDMAASALIDAYRALGEFEKAGALLAGPASRTAAAGGRAGPASLRRIWVAAETHLLAGDRVRAGRAVRDFAAARAPSAGAASDQVAESLACLAMALESSTPSAELRRRAERSTDVTCGLMLGSLLRGEERRSVLRGLLKKPGAQRLREQVLLQLAREGEVAGLLQGFPAKPFSDLATGAAGRPDMFPLDLALRRATLQALKRSSRPTLAARQLRVLLAAQLAQADVLLGRPQAGREALDAEIEASDIYRPDGDDPQPAFLLRSAIYYQLEEGAEVAKACAPSKPLCSAARGPWAAAALLFHRAVEQDQLPGDREAWLAVKAGDGLRLQQWLVKRRGLGGRFLLAPGELGSGRAELRRWVRWGDNRTCHDCSFAENLADLAQRNLAARRLEDRELSTECLRLLERHARKLDDEPLGLLLATLDLYARLALQEPKTSPDASPRQLELLHAVPTVLAVSSTAAGGAIERLFDGRHDTAWCAAKWDIQPWIAVRLPAGATVKSVLLSVDQGQGRTTIKRVALSHNARRRSEWTGTDHDYSLLRTIRHDGEKGEQGGDLYIEILAVDRRRDPQACVAELQLWGSSPSAGLATPVARVGSLGSRQTMAVNGLGLVVAPDDDAKATLRDWLADCEPSAAGDSRQEDDCERVVFCASQKFPQSDCLLFAAHGGLKRAAADYSDDKKDKSCDCHARTSDEEQPCYRQNLGIRPEKQIGRWRVTNAGLQIRRALGAPAATRPAQADGAGGAEKKRPSPRPAASQATATQQALGPWETVPIRLRDDGRTICFDEGAVTGCYHMAQADRCPED